jgi:transcriptional regulator with XRE-family HTH domain
MGDGSAVPDVLAEVGPRLRRLRERRDMTLTSVAARTGISKSTLSRLESGQRKPSLELLLPLAETYHLPLDELVGAPRVGDPRIRTRPRTRNGRLVFPLTQRSSGMAVWKVVIPPERERKLRTHAGHEWLYVLSGEMRLILGEHDITMRPGEVAEFDTRLPHWFGPAGEQPVEILSVHGSQGQKMHVRAAPRA